MVGPAAGEDGLDGRLERAERDAHGHEGEEVHVVPELVQEERADPAE